MSAKKARKRAYIPPSSEVVNRREKATTSTTRHAPRQQRGAAGARSNYEYPQPGFKRTAKRLPIYFAMIFAMQMFLFSRGNGDKAALHGVELVLASAGSAGVITLVFAPFMHMMDKLAYNRYLKRTGGTKPPADTK